MSALLGADSGRYGYSYGYGYVPTGRAQQPSTRIHRSSTESSNVLRLDRGKSTDSKTETKSEKSLKSAELNAKLKDLEAALKEGAKPQSLAKRIKKHGRHFFRKLGIKRLWPIFIITMYSIIGAAIFVSIEEPNDTNELKTKISEVKRIRRHVAAKFEEIFVDVAFENASRREKELYSVLLYYEQEIGFKLRNASDWTFINAMYYCGTLFTTIGYGNMYPATTLGRVVTIFYALIGIPLVLTVLNQMGKFLFLLIFRFVRFFDTQIARRWRRYKRRRAHRRQSLLLAAGSRRPSLWPDHLPLAPVVRFFSDSEPEPVKVEIDLLSTTTAEEKVSFPAEELEEEEQNVVMKIPVSVAICSTVGWIFFCAGLFTIWEHNWTYFTSVYFIFISLSTIGLGDVTPDHPEYMIGVFYFVIIGLSLVSMCINVIQHRIRELYRQLLQKVFEEYQKQVDTGQGEVGAALGMMQVWNKSPAARLLMPLLSTSARQNVVQQFQEDAKAQGIELPSILQDVDQKSGLPTILQAARDTEKAETDDDYQRELEKAILKVESQIQRRRSSVYAFSNLAKLIETVDGSCQTETLLETIESQTESSSLSDSEVQTDAQSAETVECQTESALFAEEMECQTENVPLDENESQTEPPASLAESQIQTECLSELEDSGIQVETPLETAESQTTADLVPLVDCFTQAEIEVKPESTELSQQTDTVSVCDMAVETICVEFCHTPSQTDLIETHIHEVQTVAVEIAVAECQVALSYAGQEEEIQTFPENVDENSYAFQTEQFYLGLKGKLTQTYFEDRLDYVADQQNQTDLPPPPPPPPPPAPAITPQCSLKRVPTKKLSNLDVPTRLSSDPEHLGYNPADGKQLENWTAISALKKRFEKKSSDGTSAEEPAMGLKRTTDREESNPEGGDDKWETESVASEAPPRSPK